jgi:thioredoxin reductase (NADPH)
VTQAKVDGAQSTDGIPADGIYDVVIIGGGPAGLSAAIYAARANLATVVLDKDPTASALGMTRKMENYPGIPEVLSGEDLLSNFRQQAEKFGAQIVTTQVFGVNLEDDIKTVMTLEQPYRGQTVIVATGSMGHQFTFQGEADLLGKGVSYCAICDAAFFKGETVAVVGEMPTIAHELDVITKFVDHAYLLLRGPAPPPEQLAQLQADPKIELLQDSHLVSIVGKQQVEGILVANHTGQEQTLPVAGVFIFLHGNQPVVDFLGHTIDLSEAGCIRVDPTDMSTSLAGVYAVGDVICKEVRQAVIAAAEGCMAALSADKYLHHRRKVKSQWS